MLRFGPKHEGWQLAARLGLLLALLSLLLFLFACGGTPTPAPTPKPTPTPTPTPTQKPPAADVLARGARLYDDWVKETKATAPAGNQPLWALQTTNTRTGSITWRCKECHGWDYKGKDGAYGKGSHATGFPGVLKASTTLSRDELLAILKGTKNSQHDFSKLMGEANTGIIVDFLKGGVVDLTSSIDGTTKKPIGANVDNGKKLYDSTCAACHGADGRTIKFDDEVVGTIAGDNPWEFVHKIRFGNPDSPMPAAVVTGWTMQQVLDVLGYSQTLPTK